MNIVRIAIGAVIVFFFISGLRRGLIRQVLEVLGIIAAFICAFYLAHRLAAYVEGKIDLSYQLAMIFSAMAIFIIVLLVFHLAGIGLQKFFKMTLLGPFDRIMGGIFGALKGIILISLILVIVMSLPFPGKYHEEILEDGMTAAIYPVLPVLFDLVISHLPGGFDFSEVSRAGDSLGKAGKAGGKIKEKIEKEKEKIEDAVKEI